MIYIFRSILAVLSNSNWKFYLSEISSLPASLKDKCLYLMSKRGWLNDDNISMVSQKLCYVDFLWGEEIKSTYLQQEERVGRYM